MKTKVIRMNPQELDMEGIREAGEILRQGGLVAVSYTHLILLLLFYRLSPGLHE